MKQFIIFALFCVSIINCFPGSVDEVKSLPGLSFKPKFRHFSGYLNSTNGRHLHYWFVESQSNPSKDPVVLWLNGGPGCSSVLGFLTEQGPFTITKNGTRLLANNYSWNLISNVIFLESPAGVGFSYKDDQEYDTNDDQVAQANYAALESFFKKFPQYKTNDFYVTGESYAGIYVPTLSVQILRGQQNINFKGFAVGNGYLDANKLGNSLVFFGYYHGLIGLSLWEKLSKFCCNEIVSQKSCRFVNNSNAQCNAAVSQAVTTIMQQRINIYNLYQNCDGASSPGLLKNKRSFGREYFDKKLMLKSIGNHPSLVSKSQGDIPCVDTSYVENWINQPQVRESLHIPSDLPRWTACNFQVESGYTNVYNTMKPQILELLKSEKNLTGVIYNGDVDMACNFLGDEW